MGDQVLSMDPNTRDWPDQLVTLANIIGNELTLKLVEKFGGVEKYYIPKLKRQRAYYHPWVDIIGKDPWVKLCKTLGGQKICLPRGCHLTLKKRLILELAEDKALSHRTIALRVGATETYVRMVLRGLDTESQLGLF